MGNDKEMESTTAAMQELYVLHLPVMSCGITAGIIITTDLHHVAWLLRRIFHSTKGGQGGTFGGEVYHYFVERWRPCANQIALRYQGAQV